MSIKNAFPNYDDVLPMLEGFYDQSYKNDSCPSIHKQIYKDIYLVLYCDYKNINRRDNPNGFRYQLALDMPMLLCNSKILLLSDNIMEVKHFINTHDLDDFICMPSFDY